MVWFVACDNCQTNLRSFHNWLQRIELHVFAIFQADHQDKHNEEQRAPPPSFTTIRPETRRFWHRLDSLKALWHPQIIFGYIDVSFQTGPRQNATLADLPSEGPSWTACEELGIPARCSVDVRSASNCTVRSSVASTPRSCSASAPMLVKGACHCLVPLLREQFLTILLQCLGGHEAWLCRTAVVLRTRTDPPVRPPWTEELAPMHTLDFIMRTAGDLRPARDD